MISRGSLSLLLVSCLAITSCDNLGDVSDITINVTINGTGSGDIEAKTIGVNIDCRVQEGAVSGSCNTSFTDRNGGVIRLEATPDAVTDFTWGGDCRREASRQCELTFGEGEDAIFDVVGTFEAKTKSVIITPKPITMTVAGAEGTVVVQAQALDENGAEVFGVSYTWASSDASVVTVTPQANNRAAALVALKNGSAIISATTQGLTGAAQVDVSLTN